MRRRSFTVVWFAHGWQRIEAYYSVTLGTTRSQIGVSWCQTRGRGKPTLHPQAHAVLDCLQEVRIEAFIILVHMGARVAADFFLSPGPGYINDQSASSKVPKW